MENKHLIILIIIALICVGIFIYQFNNNVATFITLNETQVEKNGSFTGILTDSYGWAVPNETISFIKPGGIKDTIKTDENGKFQINNAEYIPNKENYYSNFTFNGDGKYQECQYECQVKVI